MANNDIGLVFTSCLFPEFVQRATESVLSYYPDYPGIIVNDLPGSDGIELLEEAATKHGLALIHNDQRIGTGKSIDRAVRVLETKYIVTVDHGIELRLDGIIELYLKKMKEGVIGVGPKRGDKRCNAAFGHYIDPVLALWDREAVIENNLSFKLTHIRIGDWQVDGCSTAQLLLYRAMRLGYKPGYIGQGLLNRYARHHRTPKTRGRCSSPHDLTVVDEDYMIPRRRRADGSLVFDRRINE
ncbi:MAG: glycosyltransferase [Candidatus Thorarchaeota archaeon]